MTLFYLDGMAGIDWARALLSGEDAELVAGELAERVVLQTTCVPRAVAAQEWLGAL